MTSKVAYNALLLELYSHMKYCSGHDLLKRGPRSGDTETGEVDEIQNTHFI